ncbi:MAG TPA: PepSY-associated TM helix domain-containing protein, partial [Bacteroidota bacterium]
MRKIILKLHLYFALAGCVFVAILGLTGSIMAFEGELDRLFNPSLYSVHPEPSRLRSISALTTLLEEKYPGAHVVGFGIADRPDESFSAFMDNGSGVFINQYTGEVLGTRSSATFLDYVHQFHIRLLAGHTGQVVVGVAGIVMFLLVLTGIILWWRYKQFSMKLNGSFVRAMFDLHTVTGIYTAVVLLFLSATGIIISQENSVYPWLYKITKTQRIARSVPSTPREGIVPITADSAVTLAKNALPGANPLAVFIPSKPTQSFNVRMHFPEDLTPGGRSWVCIDQYSGEVLVSQNSRTAPGPTRAEIINRAIHTGDILGLFSKIVASLSSFLVVVQALSGILLWWKRDRKNR